jgi:SOS-response transcriptional repressor LexA
VEEKRSLGEEIAYLRRKNGLTQIGLAERVKTTQAAISAYETGKMAPSPEVLKRIADALGADFDYLLSLPKTRMLKGEESRKAHDSLVNAGGKFVSVAEVSDVVPVPVLGHVHAGDPNILPDRDIVDVLKLPRRIARSADYALLIKGMSMVEAGISEGDIVLVKCQPDAENNDIVIARIGDEYTIKRLRKNERGEAWLEPANPRYKPIRGKPFEVVAKIVYAIKKF